MVMGLMGLQNIFLTNKAVILYAPILCPNTNQAKFTKIGHSLMWLRKTIFIFFSS